MSESSEILQTERLLLRELEATRDAGFVLELLNTPKFIQFIGDRGVRSIQEAAVFIETRYREGYRAYGYGLYAVDRLEDGKSIGMCGFVRRDSLDGPDIGFAFLPQYERMGYGFESAKAMMDYGRDTLNFETVFAIATPENAASKALLEKLGLKLERQIEIGSDVLDLFQINFR